MHFLIRQDNKKQIIIKLYIPALPRLTTPHIQKNILQKKFRKKFGALRFPEPGGLFSEKYGSEELVELRCQYTTLGYAHKTLHFSPILLNYQGWDSVYAVL